MSGSSKNGIGRSLAEEGEGAFPLGPRPLPEGEVGQVDLVEARAPSRGPWTPPYRRPPGGGEEGGGRSGSGTSRPQARQQRGPGLLDATGFDQRTHLLVEQGRPRHRVGGPPRLLDALVRASSSSPARMSTPAGTAAARRSRTHRARAGLAPPVETATVSGPRPVDGGELHGPGRGAIGPAGRHAGLGGVGDDLPVHLGPPGGRGDQVVPARLTGTVGADLDVEGAPAGPGVQAADGLPRLDGHQGDPGTGLEQSDRPAGCHRPTAHDQAPPPGEAQHDRVSRRARRVARGRGT